VVLLDIGGVLISMSWAIEAVGGHITKSVTVDARPAVTFQASGHHRPVIGTM